MTRDEYIGAARQLLAEGDRLQANPSLPALQVWLKLSDDLLAAAWGSMDRYHLAWLTVGKSRDVVRGRRLTTDEEHAYVRDVANQKASVLAMSLDAVERQGMPFVGESGGVGTGGEIGTLADLSERLAEARRGAEDHREHPASHGGVDDAGRRRAPRPDRMER